MLDVWEPWYPWPYNHVRVRLSGECRWLRGHGDHPYDRGYPADSEPGHDAILDGLTGVVHGIYSSFEWSYRSEIEWWAGHYYSVRLDDCPCGYFRGGGDHRSSIRGLKSSRSQFCVEPFAAIELEYLGYSDPCPSGREEQDRRARAYWLESRSRWARALSRGSEEGVRSGRMYQSAALLRLETRQRDQVADLSQDLREDRLPDS